METAELFNSYQLRKKFDSDQLNRVQNWMQANGYLTDPVVMPGTMASALILLSFTATESDLQEYGEIILNASTGYREPETLQYVLSYLLSDPLNSATVQQLIFDRQAGRVTLQLVDDSEIKAINLPVILTPDWKAEAGVQWSREELVHLVGSIQEETAGDLITDTEFQALVTEHDHENNLN